jgi:twitching motility protein PilT
MSDATAKPGPDPAALRDMEKLMLAALRSKASDIHIKAGQKPLLRVNTVLHEVGQRALTAEDTERMVDEIMSDEQRVRFEDAHDLDFAYSLPGVGRFRINVFHDRGSVAAAVRRVNTTIPGFDELHLPAATKRLAEMHQGLVIVAGATGSGKSTTIACVIDHINATEKLHILTIEDPVEYLFTDRQSYINQREIGIDVPDWHQALKHMVRQDPDVILIGEMRDYVSFDAALMAAETGHLVFATVHASTAAQTVGRLLDLFPTDRQGLIRQSLAFNLRAILCQRLVPSSREGVKMVPAVEILFNTAMAQKLLVGAEDKKLSDLLRISKEEGMQDFNMSLMDLIDRGLITQETALANSPHPEQLRMNLQGIFLADEHRILG